MTSVIYHPDAEAFNLTMASEGLQVVPQPHGSDSFVFASRPDATLSVAMAEIPDVMWVGDDHMGGLIWEGADRLEFVYNLGMGRALVATATSWDLDEFKMAVGSIPVIGNRSAFDPPTDEPLVAAPSVSDLRDLFGIPFEVSEVKYDSDHGPLQSVDAVYRPGEPDWWALFMASEELNPLREFAMSTPNGRFLEGAAVATIVGEQRNGGPRQAYWVQRRQFWHLATGQSSVDLVDRVRSAQRRLEVL